MDSYSMADVRRALWKAYKKVQKSEYGIEGKRDEAWCELGYPNLWDAETEDEFTKPCEIMIYSYALGPSRRHYIRKGNVEKAINNDKNR